ncbi:MAG: low molecular weight protein-tyrosine-phosphatase [Polaromonas sp.]|uniref:low molecular weight protein-tyrosine-phosphatase n=1 Tax=Polaromonas sp. TaxID=1869339 RepID=UPI0040370837
MKPCAILFVCMGNICRSPTAHGVLLKMVQDRDLGGQVQVDSAGTHNYHPGHPPDERSQAHASRRGYDLSGLRARQISDLDFERHDLILAMDWDNLALIQQECPAVHLHKVRRLTEFCLRHNSPVVPDPYHGGKDGFEHVLDLVEDACEGLIQWMKNQGRIGRG